MKSKTYGTAGKRWPERRSLAARLPLWWPPAKIVGRYLAPFLAAHLGLGAGPPETSHAGAVEVELELDPRDHTLWSSV